MKTKLTIVLSAAASLFATGTTLHADSDTDQKIAAHFFTPELIMKTHEVLNLSDEQKNTLREAWEDSQEKVARLQEQLRAETDKFIDLAKQRHLDEKAIFAQGDKVLDAEGKVKHAQLSLLVLIKNTLTPEQQATLNGIKSLDPKIKEAQQIVEKWKAEGRDLSPLAGAKSEIESLLKDGKVKEAEAAIDRALKLLSEKSGK